MPLAEQIFEYPLSEWTDIAGSKIKLGAKLRSLWELTSIWYRYMSPWSSYGTGGVGSTQSSAGGGNTEL